MIEGIRLVRYHYRLLNFDVAPHYFSFNGAQSQEHPKSVFEYSQSAVQASKDIARLIHDLQAILRSLPEDLVYSGSGTKAFGFDASCNSIVGYVIEVNIDGRWLNLFNPKVQAALSKHDQTT